MRVICNAPVRPSFLSCFFRSKERWLRPRPTHRYAMFALSLHASTAANGRGDLAIADVGNLVVAPSHEVGIVKRVHDLHCFICVLGTHSPARLSIDSKIFSLVLLLFQKKSLYCLLAASATVPSRFFGSNAFRASRYSSTLISLSACSCRFNCRSPPRKSRTWSIPEVPDKTLRNTGRNNQRPRGGFTAGRSGWQCPVVAGD